MSSFRAIRLVAVREILERARSRGFLVALVVTVILVVGVVLFSGFVISGSPDRVTVIFEGSTGVLQQPIVDLGRALQLEIDVKPATGSDADRAAVRSGDVDAVITGDPAQPRVIVQHKPNQLLTQILAEATAARELQQRFIAAGLPPDRAANAATVAPPTVESLQPVDRDSAARTAAASIGDLLLYISILMGGVNVATSIVADKSGRVVELLLATLRPAQLLAGKVLGVGLLGVAQFTAVVLAGGITAIAIGTARIPSAALVAVPHLVLWFILGYALYSVLYAGTGAMAQRVEELQSVTLPLSLVIIVGFLISSVAPASIDSAVVRIAALFPLTAPLVMPIRAISGAAAPWEEPLAIALILLTIVGAIRLGGMIFRRALLVSGSRVRWRQVLRGGAHSGEPGDGDAQAAA